MSRPGVGSRSEELLERAARLIPGASQTVSKGPSQWARGVAPLFAARAEGPFLWDIEGTRYFDLPMALGPVILGHCHPAVREAIQGALQDGITFTLPHPLETEVAERIVAAVPNAEMVRFGKTGSDATSAAIRAARAITGREHVAFSGYHGWHDWHIGATSWHSGVPLAVRELTHSFEFGDLGALDALIASRPGELAAVILEPAGAHEPSADFLQGVAERVRGAGALLIYDEIITGFRLAMGGAQERYGVEPDLACFGKALANGMPLSAVVGPERLMRVFEREIFFSGTHGGEILSLAACRATLDVLSEEPVHERLWDLGTKLMDAINDSAVRRGMSEHLAVTGAAPRSIVSVSEPDPEAGLVAKTFLQQELAKRGVLFNGSNFICNAHSERDIEAIASAYDEAISQLAELWPDGLEPALEAPVLRPVFTRT